MSITSDDIINGAKRRIVVPSNGVTDEDILHFCDSIVSSDIVPMIESAQQDYFVTFYETPLVTGISEYNIPYRAIGRATREVKLRDPSNFYYNLPLVSIENAYSYSQFAYVMGFHFLSDKIKLVPELPSGYQPDTTLCIWYGLPPNKLVEQDLVSTVVSVNFTTGVVTVDGVPGDFVDGYLVDFVQGVSGNSIEAMDIPIVSFTDTTITFLPANLPLTLAAGDYISTAGESYVLNFIPNECYSLIESLTARRICQAISDYDGMKALDSDIQVEKVQFSKIIEPRVVGENTIILNNFNITRSRSSWYRSWLFNGR